MTRIRSANIQQFISTFNEYSTTKIKQKKDKKCIKQAK